MRGSIKKRGSTYTYVVDIGPDPATGKRRQRTKGGFRTRKECLDEAAPWRGCREQSVSNRPNGLPDLRGGNRKTAGEAG
jgi:Arm DNA-binding domain